MRSIMSVRLASSTSTLPCRVAQHCMRFICRAGSKNNVKKSTCKNWTSKQDVTWNPGRLLTFILYFYLILSYRYTCAFWRAFTKFFLLTVAASPSPPVHLLEKVIMWEINPLHRRLVQAKNSCPLSLCPFLSNQQINIMPQTVWEERWKVETSLGVWGTVWMDPCQGPHAPDKPRWGRPPAWSSSSSCSSRWHRVRPSSGMEVRSKEKYFKRSCILGNDLDEITWERIE